MTSSRCNFYDRFKDRRYGFLFWLTFVLVIGSLITPGVFEMVRDYAGEYFGLVATGLALMIVAGVAACVRRCRRPGRYRWEYRPLSDNEVTKARSKLVKCQNWRRT